MPLDRMSTDQVTALIHQVAAEVINPRWRALRTDEIHEKAPGDLVTDADREAEVALTAALAAANPGALVVGEEAIAADPSLLTGLPGAEHAFVIDPIDGTRNFVDGSADHAVMVAETRSGEVTRAWIHQPQHGIDYVTERGAGVLRNGSAPPPLQPGAAANWVGQASRRRWLGPARDGVPDIGTSHWCCGIDYPEVLEGRCQLLIYSGRATPNPWDHAPGSLMVAELGGLTRELDGDPYRLDSSGQPIVVCAGSIVWDTVIDGLRRR